MGVGGGGAEDLGDVGSIACSQMHSSLAPVSKPFTSIRRAIYGENLRIHVASRGTPRQRYCRLLLLSGDIFPQHHF